MGKEEAEAQRLKKRCEGGADERTWQSQQYCQEGTGVVSFHVEPVFLIWFLHQQRRERTDWLVPKQEDWTQTF